MNYCTADMARDVSVVHRPADPQRLGISRKGSKVADICIAVSTCTFHTVRRLTFPSSRCL